MKMPRLAAALSIVLLGVSVGATPALAAGATPGLISTGLTDGQYVGTSQRLHPVWTNVAAVTEVDLYVNRELRSQFRYQEWLDNRLYLDFDDAADGTDALIELLVFSRDGFTESASTRVHVDTRPPTATFAPERNAFIHGNATITVTPTSDDVASIGLYDFDVKIAEDTAAPWKLVVDTRTMPVSTNYGLVVRDRAGNAIAFDTNYRIDNTGPVIDAYHDFAKAVPTGVSELSTGIEDQAEIGRIEWWIDGVRRGTGWSVRHDFGKVQRTATVEVRAWDKLGNGSRKTFKVLVDKSGPSVVWKAPGKYVRGSTMVSTVAASDPAGVQYAVLNENRYDYSAPYSRKLGTGRDGKRTLSWTVYDWYGNHTTISRVITVDNTKPTLVVTKAPKSGAKVGGKVKVKLSASDRYGIARVELLINGKVVAKDLKAGYGFTLDTKPYGEKFKVTFRAYDRAGNARSTTTRVWHR
jgi:hypothetical protein